MDAAAVKTVLERALPGTTFEVAPAVDVPTLYVPAEQIAAVCRALREEADLAFVFLSDVTAVDWWPADPRFEVVYHLVSFVHNARVRIKVRLPGEDPHLADISSLFPVANWQEREVYDLFGIYFDGHPDLRRLLMPEDWDGHPLRKDYPVQIKMTPKVYEPLQVTEEEFRKRMEADRAVRTTGETTRNAERRT
jgi:NADH-quinone oxidoreductase subunit C